MESGVDFLVRRVVVSNKYGNGTKQKEESFIVMDFNTIFKYTKEK